MAKTKKFLLISMGGLVALMMLGMIFSIVTDTRPEEVSSMNLISEWKWYRVTLYLLIVGSWPWLVRYATRPPAMEEWESETDRELMLQKHRDDYKNMKAQWWKIALLLAFIEVVMIQQFGFGE
jgi:predicted nucleic acid-binding Zn ribbon protein